MNSFSLYGWTRAKLMLGLALVLLAGCAVPQLTPTSEPTVVPRPPTPTASQPLADTNWMLVELQGDTSTAVQGVTANFDRTDQIVGWSGCNSYSAQYQVQASAITIATVMTTTNTPCSTETSAGVESTYLATLGKAIAFQIAGVDLLLQDASAATLLRYRALQAVQLAGSTWVLNAYRGENGQLTNVLPASPAMPAVFDQGVLKGYSGCVNYQATYSLVGTALTIQAVTVVAGLSTNPGCVEGGTLRSQEEAFLAALPLTQSASIQGAQLTLLTAQGEPVAVFTFVAAPA